jgi:hypothetical protein
MEALSFIKEYWVLITAFIGLMSTFFVFILAMIQSVKCLLRNDILSIYDKCKEDKKITYWQLQAVEKSYKLYRLLKGNSFIKDLMERIREFELID